MRQDQSKVDISILKKFSHVGFREQPISTAGKIQDMAQQAASYPHRLTCSEGNFSKILLASYNGALDTQYCKNLAKKK